MSVTRTTTPAVTQTHLPATHLSAPRLLALRGGYLLLGLGLAIVKWPHLGSVDEVPLYEGVTLCMLTAMSLLAFLGVRHPVPLLPVLLFEVLWKVLWLALVALPVGQRGGMGAAMSDTVVNCSLVVVIMLVVPWDYVWAHLVRTPRTT